MTYEETLSIIDAGGGMRVDARQYSYFQLSNFAQKARSSGATLVVRNAKKLSYVEMLNLAKAGRGHIIFEE